MDGINQVPDIIEQCVQIAFIHSFPHFSFFSLLISFSSTPTRINSPESFADNVTTLLRNDANPGRLFPQDQVGSFTTQDAIPSTAAAITKWEETPTKTIKLSTLRRIYEGKHADQAIRLLN